MILQPTVSITPKIMNEKTSEELAREAATEIARQFKAGGLDIIKGSPVENKTRTYIPLTDIILASITQATAASERKCGELEKNLNETGASVLAHRKTIDDLRTELDQVKLERDAANDAYDCACKTEAAYKAQLAAAEKQIAEMGEALEICIGHFTGGMDGNYAPCNPVDVAKQALSSRQPVTKL